MDRDTTSTPYKASPDGLIYFRYPNGDKPAAEVFVTQDGAGSGDGSSLDNATAIGSLNWSSVEAGTQVWLCGTFTGTPFTVNGGGVNGRPIILRGDYPGNAGVINANHFEFTSAAAQYVTVKNLTINSVVRAGAVAYYNNHNLTFADRLTLVNNQTSWSSHVGDGRIMTISGPATNGAGRGYEVDSANGNTLTIKDTGSFTFTPESDTTAYSITFYYKHHGITMDGCLMKPTIAEYNGEIFEMNMGDNITLLNCEMDGSSQVYHGATYNEGRKHATQRSNHLIKGCYVHDIGRPDQSAQPYDNHGFGIQKANNYVLEECNIERVACGMVLFPGGGDEGANPNQGIYNMVIRYCRLAECDMDRHLSQFPACGIVGSGNTGEDSVGTWQYHNNLIVDTIGREATGATYEALALTCKGDASVPSSDFKIYNNTVYTTSAGNGWNQGIYLANLINGGTVRNNIIHGVKQNDVQFAQVNLPSTPGFTSDYNLFADDWATGFRVGGGATNFAGLQASGNDTNSRVANPNLNEATMRPQAGSEAIGNGTVVEAGQRWLGAVTWPTGTDGGSFEYIDLTGAPTIGAFAEEGV
jgi:hypothetical protein